MVFNKLELIQHRKGDEYLMNIKDYWKTIDQYLIKYSPNTYNSLMGPASDTEIKRLMEIIKLPLPETLIQSLIIHNGQEHMLDSPSFIAYHNLLSCSDIIKVYDMMNEICPEEDDATVWYINPDDCKYVKTNYIWNKKWIPITEANSGDGLLIDFDPAPFGQSGQIIYRANTPPSADKPISNSYSDWLKTICERLENGQFSVEDEIINIDRLIYDF